MWLSEYVTGKPFVRGESAAGEIRSTSPGGVNISAARDYRTVPLIAPAGITYVPAAGAQTVVLPSDGGAVCLGVVTAPASDLEAGELMFRSAGGASIVLKNDGSVLINGRAVS